MRKSKSLGGEPQLAMVLLLVCGPVLLGLWFLFFSVASSFGAFIFGVATHPADEPAAILFLIIWMGMLTPASPDSPDDDEAAPSGDKLTIMLWFAAVGIMIGLTVARSELSEPAGLSRNIAAYVAIAAATLHLLVVWLQPSDQTFGRMIIGALILSFLCWLLYLWLVKDEGGKALFFALFMVGMWIFRRLADRNAEEIDYRRHRWDP